MSDKTKEKFLKVLRIILTLAGNMYLVAIVVFVFYMGRYSYEESYYMWSTLPRWGIFLIPLGAFGLMRDFELIFSIYNFFQK